MERGTGNQKVAGRGQEALETERIVERAESTMARRAKAVAEDVLMEGLRGIEEKAEGLLEAGFMVEVKNVGELREAQATGLFNSQYSRRIVWGSP